MLNRSYDTITNGLRCPLCPALPYCKTCNTGDPIIPLLRGNSLDSSKTPLEGGVGVPTHSLRGGIGTIQHPLTRGVLDSWNTPP